MRALGIASALALVVALVTALAPAACGDPGRGASAEERVPLVVFAAASLTEAFEALERDYERAHPRVDVQLAFAGSQVLRLQIEHGAAADVFASANESHMQALVDAGDVTSSQTFARNELVVIVPTSNPSQIGAFEELARARRIVIGSDNVPVGIYTRQLLERARARLGPEFARSVRERVVSEENNVRHVRAKVELAEADAAIVYRTDAASSRRVHVVPIPDELNVHARYPIGQVAHARHAEEAAHFIAYTRSPEGQETLRQHGFRAEAP